MSDNEFHQPLADTIIDVSKGSPHQADIRLSSKMMEHLGATRPWVLFLGILGFVGAGFAALAMLGWLALGLMGMSQLGPGAEKIQVLTSFLYLPLIGIYILFSVLLVRYASAIGRLLDSCRASDMENALLKQKTFWKAAGIIAIVSIGLMLAAFIVGIVVALSVGLRGIRGF
jgi:magnesium-transporting ATPase (P-type)